MSSLDFSPGLLVGFALWLEQGDEELDRAPAAPSTIRRRFYGANAALREHGVDVPPGATIQANEAVKAYERRLAQTGQTRGTGPAPAVTVKQLRTMCAELAHLSVTDIHDDPSGLVVQVRYSKTGERTVAVPPRQEAAGLPRGCLARLARAGRITAGRVCRSIDRHGRVGDAITAHSIGRTVNNAADRAGLMVHFTAHSLRSGLATESRRAGHDPLAIARQGG